MIKTAYFRAYMPADQVGSLAPARPNDSVPPVMHNGRFMWTESTTDDALFIVWEGSQYACPRNARLRMIEGILAFGKMYPMMQVVSEAERLVLVAELSELRNASPLARSFILSSPWHVPLRWFSAFAPSDRDVYNGPNGLSIRYRTSIGEAVDRVHWSSAVLAGASFPAHVVERINDLERWLMEFSADSIVELDYGDVAGVFPDADLTMDESADDVRRSLLALERGDGEGSQRHYETVASRWYNAQSFTFSN